MNSIEKMVEDLKKFSETVVTDRSIEIEYDDKSISVDIDSVPAISVVLQNNDRLHFAMLPDLYTYSKFDRITNLHFDSSVHKSVSFDTNMDFADVLSAIKQAVLDINLYGYEVE